MAVLLRLNESFYWQRKQSLLVYILCYLCKFWAHVYTDGRSIIVSNASLLGTEIVNYTRSQFYAFGLSVCLLEERDRRVSAQKIGGVFLISSRSTWISIHHSPKFKRFSKISLDTQNRTLLYGPNAQDSPYSLTPQSWKYVIAHLKEIEHSTNVRIGIWAETKSHIDWSVRYYWRHAQHSFLFQVWAYHAPKNHLIGHVLAMISKHKLKAHLVPQPVVLNQEHKSKNGDVTLSPFSLSSHKKKKK